MRKTDLKPYAKKVIMDKKGKALDTKKLIGQKIKELRKQKGFTQEKLAEKIGVDTGYISKMEVGLNAPSIKTFENLAIALDVEISSFFSFVSPRTSDNRKEILKIYDNLSDEKKVLLYRIVKAFK